MSKIVDNISYAMIFFMVVIMLPGTIFCSPLTLIESLYGYYETEKFLFYACLVILSILLTSYLVIRAKNIYLVLGNKNGLTLSTDIAALFYVVFFLSCIRSISDQRYTYMSWQIVFGTVFSLFMIISSSKKVNIIIFTVILSVLFESICSIFYYFTGRDTFNSPFVGIRAGGTYNNPNSLYPFELIGFSLCIFLASSKTYKNTWYRVIFVITSLLSFLTIILTYTRAAWMAVVISLAVYAVTYTTSSSTKNKLSNRVGIFQSLAIYSVIFALCVTLIMGVVFIRTGGRLVASGSDTSSMGRIEIYKVACDGILKEPIFGYGINSYAGIQEEFMSAELSKYKPHNIEPKNLFLNITIEQGYIGIIILFVLIIALFFQSKNQQLMKTYDIFFRRGIICSLCSILIAGLFDTTILNYTRVPATSAFFMLFTIMLPSMPGRE